MTKKPLDSAVVLFGILSFLGLAAFYMALHDIGHDYASPEVWARAGQTLPIWYSPVNQCPLEWRVMQIAFLLMLVFHILLVVKLSRSRAAR